MSGEINEIEFRREIEQRKYKIQIRLQKNNIIERFHLHWSINKITMCEIEYLFCNLDEEEEI